jgi:hypothetical protein
MRKKIILISGILILCLVGWGLRLYFKTRPDIGSLKPSVSISATDLYVRYQKDETTANSLFLQKIISVNGEIADVMKTDSTLSFQLKGGETGGINCSIRNIPATIPQKGNKVSIKGRCSGFLMDVNLVDCVLEKP